MAQDRSAPRKPLGPLPRRLPGWRLLRSLLPLPGWASTRRFGGRHAHVSRRAHAPAEALCCSDAPSGANGN